MRKTVYDVYSPFDIEKHRTTFVNYLEVVIKPKGVVEYAVPSHQIKLEDILCEKWNCSTQDVRDRCPQEYWGDYLRWLCDMSKCVSVWNHCAVYPKKVTAAQKSMLIKLEKYGLYKPNRSKLL